MTYQKCIDHSKMYRFMDCYGCAICIHYLPESEDNVELYWVQSTHTSIFLHLSAANIPWWTVSLTSIHNLKGIQINLCVWINREKAQLLGISTIDNIISLYYMLLNFGYLCVFWWQWLSNTRNYYIKLLYIFLFLAVQI